MWGRAEYILKQVATPHFWQHIGHHLAPLTLSDWRLATLRRSKLAQLRQQSVCSHFRGEGERRREKAGSVWAVISTLIFSLEKSSTLQGGVTVKCFQFVLCGNCFLPRLTSATCEQFEKSGLCSFQDSYVLYTREEAFLLSWESALVKLNQASQWDSTKSNLDTDMHLVTLRIDLSVTTCHALISGQ